MISCSLHAVSRKTMNDLDDERFNRVGVSVDRALERAVRGLREAQAARRARQQSVIIDPQSRQPAGQDKARESSG